MTERRGVFTNNHIIFFPRAGETENVPEFELERF